MHDDARRKAVQLLLGIDGAPLAEVSDKALALVRDALEMEEVQPKKRQLFAQTFRLRQVASDPLPVTPPAVSHYFG